MIESCPKCANPKLKSWDELKEDEKTLVRKLPMNTEFSMEARKTHLFCGRCWYELTIDPARRHPDHA